MGRASLRERKSEREKERKREREREREREPLSLNIYDFVGITTAENISRVPKKYRFFIFFKNI